MKRKCLAIGIILLFVGTSIIPAIAQDTEKTLPTSRGNWLYVGGSGPGNYTKIQDAVNNASEGDTVYVYNGTYHEALSINVMSLNVVGEGRDVTCINANFTSEAVVISQSYVSLCGFTIIGKNYCVYVTEGLTAITVSHNNLSKRPDILYGVCFEYDGDVENNWNVLENNIFYSNSHGIGLYGSEFSTIRNNTFVNNGYGLDISGNNNRILNNTFLDCRLRGLRLYGGPSKVEGNIFIGNDIGLEVRGSENSIIGNLFEDNTIGVRLYRVSNTLVTQNNFIKNRKHATFYEDSRSHGNNWDNNYWSGLFYLFGYKFIFGRIQTRIPWFQFDPEVPAYYFIRWINFDKQPAQEPYDIPGMN